MFDEMVETEAGEEDEDRGLIFPYQFELYADEEDQEDETEQIRIHEDIGRLQNVEW